MERILVDSWERLAAQLGGKFVYRTTDEVPDFFKEIAGTGREVVLVSACNDSGVHLQTDAHPNADLFKLAASVAWGDAAAERGVYHQVQVGPACLPDKCDPSHRYSLKTDRFTWGTFDKVPDEVRHWFTTNLNCYMPRTTMIPFGLNNHGHGASLLPGFVGREKKSLLYVNFQENSLTRVHLKRHFSRESWATFRPEANLPVEQYLAELAEAKFVLCPAGNGLDSYRIWEALYLGCIPILEDSYFARRLFDMRLPVAVSDNLSMRSPDGLEKLWEELKCFNLIATDLSYWRGRLVGKLANLGTVD